MIPTTISPWGSTAFLPGPVKKISLISYVKLYCTGSMKDSSILMDLKLVFSPKPSASASFLAYIYGLRDANDRRYVDQNWMMWLRHIAAMSHYAEVLTLTAWQDISVFVPVHSYLMLKQCSSQSCRKNKQVELLGGHSSVHWTCAKFYP